MPVSIEDLDIIPVMVFGRCHLVTVWRTPTGEYMSTHNAEQVDESIVSPPRTSSSWIEAYTKEIVAIAYARGRDEDRCYRAAG